MKKILWASRHALDPEAEKSLSMIFEDGDWNEVPVPPEIHQQEVLWPDEASACQNLARTLLTNFDALAGIWPAQAVEGLLLACSDTFPNMQVVSPVSAPETEPDIKKVRPFRFVRWARIWPIG